MTWEVDWTVMIDGRDVTPAMRPYLTHISVADKDGTSGDTASMTFDDADGQCLLPADDAELDIALQGVVVFTGVVESVRSTGSRGGGRTLSVNAVGFDVKGGVKTVQRWHMDDATLEAALAEGARRAGLDGVTVDPALAGIARDYWSPDGQSFLAWGQALAREFGATFKIRRSQAVFARRGDGRAPSGAPLPTVRAAFGDNLLRWSIAPLAGRRKYRTVEVRYFDRETGRYETRTVETEVAEGRVTNRARNAAADADQADAIAQGRKTEAEREGGGGSVELLLAVEAQAEGTVELSGARPGVDGVYRITGVTHRASRDAGSTTALELKQPGQGTGSDDRA